MSGGELVPFGEFPIPGAASIDARIDSQKGAAEGVASLDEQGRVPESELPARLAEAALSATIAQAIASVKPAPVVARQMGGLVTLLNAGRSAAFSVHGDSTGDSDGSSAAQDRLAARFARRLAERYPAHHVLMKTWNPTTEDYRAWVEVQAASAGRRCVVTTTRALRHNPGHAAVQFASTNRDVRVLLAANQWASGAEQNLVSLGHSNTTLSWRLRINAAGFLQLWLSNNGTSLNMSQATCDAALPVADGQPIWVRATVEIDTATPSRSTKFYTSTDGVTWTQLGSTVIASSAATIFQAPATDPTFFTLAGPAWQPVSSTFRGRIFEVQIRDGIDGPLIAPAAVESWERYGDSATTYAGAPTLYVINASRSGSDMAYHVDPTRLRKMTPDHGQVAAIFNDSHNEGTRTGSLWIAPYEAWVSAVRSRLPNAAVSVVGQNPHTAVWANEAAYGPEHVTRIMELAAAAARLGWGFVNVYQAYLDDPRGLAALVSADGLHPTAAGYALSGDTVARTAGIAV